MNNIQFGREICGNLSLAETREWLVTNGIGGYASGTVAGVLTRRYHGLLVAALEPPLGRTLLLAKLDETASYDRRDYPLCSNRWRDGSVDPQGYRHIETFVLEGTVPTWHFALGDALLEKRIWMAQGANTTYVQYHLRRASQPLHLTLKALVNYRDYHGNTQGQGWPMAIAPLDDGPGLSIQASPEAQPLYLWSDRGQMAIDPTWYYNFALAIEHYRGLSDYEHHLQAATLTVTLQPGETLTCVASSDRNAGHQLNGAESLRLHRAREQKLLQLWHETQNPAANPRVGPAHSSCPDWIQQLVLAADQFIVNRPSATHPKGKTILAGYPWFSDWGRDTMISLPGLTLVTGRPEIARSILRTFAQAVDQGMIPNRFPDAGDTPEYNTVDATLWYFEALRQYYAVTEDDSLLQELFPILTDIIDWHCRGTRYRIHLDAADGLLYAGEPGVQLTWMDAKVGDWVVTPRIGKPVEINALWYCAVRTLAKFARRLGKPYQEYEAIADRTLAKFSRFWNAASGYCYDVLDGPNGPDDALRPNQLLAISLPGQGPTAWPSLLSKVQQNSIVETCGRALLTSYGLRSLSPSHPNYQGHYGGNQRQRDGAYHQGTTWGWFLGPFVQAHLQVHQDPAIAQQLLSPIAHHLHSHGLGTISEIFDGDAPMHPRGCIAQAWSVAEILRVWAATCNW